MPRFRNLPEWIQNEKVAETCEFDGKEPLFHKTAMGISKEFWHEDQFCDHFPRLTFLNVRSRTRTAISPDFALFFKYSKVISSRKFFFAEEVDLSFNSETKEHPRAQISNLFF